MVGSYGELLPIEEGVDMINCFDNSQKFLPGCVIVTGVDARASLRQ